MIKLTQSSMNNFEGSPLKLHYGFIEPSNFGVRIFNFLGYELRFSWFLDDSVLQFGSWLMKMFRWMKLL